MNNPILNVQTWQQYVLRGILLTFFVTLLEFLGFLHGVRSIGERLFQPVMVMGAQVVNTSELPYQILAKNFQKYQHVEDLELRYAEALAQLAEIDRLRQENTELRSLLSDAKQQSTTQIIAPVISYGKPFIAIGSERGIVEGNMVLIHDTLIGRIGQVSSNQAEVVLLSNVNNVPVLAKTEHGVTGTVSGDGRRIILHEIPIEAELQNGERVVTVGQPGVAPGISLGRVTGVEKPIGSPTQQASIDQLVSFYESQIVEVKQE